MSQKNAVFDFEAHVRAWCQTTSDKFGGGKVKWVCFDGTQKKMKKKDWKTRKLHYTMQDVHYKAPSSSIEEPSNATSTEFVNDSPLIQQQ
jgi:hypothetical protein